MDINPFDQLRDVAMLLRLDAKFVGLADFLDAVSTFQSGAADARRGILVDLRTAASILNNLAVDIGSGT